MTEYRKRLEEAAAGLEDLTRGPASAIVCAYGIGGRTAFAQDLRSLLEEGEKLRGELAKISVGGPDVELTSETYTSGFDQGAAWAGRIARQALDPEK